MSIWNLLIKKVEKEVEAGECAPPVDMFEKAVADSVRPFAAECITGVVTHRGLCHEFKKPSERYHLANPDLITKFRARQVARFNEVVQSMPASGVRNIYQGEDHAALNRKAV